MIKKKLYIYIYILLIIIKIIILFYLMTQIVVYVENLDLLKLYLLKIQFFMYGNSFLCFLLVMVLKNHDFIIK